MLTSYSAFNKGNSPPFDLSKDEFESLCKTKNKNNLVIQKAVTSSNIVILDKDCYLKSVEALLTDFSKFKNVPVALDKNFNYVINSESRVTDLLKNLKTRTQSVKKSNKPRTVNSKLRTLYGSAKVHKHLKMGLPSFRPILSAIGTPTYKLAKFLFPVLSNIIENEFRIWIPKNHFLHLTTSFIFG